MQAHGGLTVVTSVVIVAMLAALLAATIGSR